MRELKFRFRDHEYKIIDRDVLKKLKTMSLSNILSGLHKSYIPMQYTGLKDKNGKEIYEGDIIQYKDIRSGREHIYLVYQEGLNWYLGINTDGGHLLENIRHEQTNKKRQEEQNRKQYEDNHPLVIGNIHQTPELL